MDLHELLARWHVGVWDYLLLTAVVSMTLMLAYLPSPRLKAFVLMMPIPFSLATLMMGNGVTVSTVFGVFALVLFTTSVRLLYTRAKWPIVLSLGVSLGGYCVLGALIAHFIPDSDRLFWVSLALLFVTGLVIGWWMPHRDEPHHRTPLPVWKKAPIVFCVVVCLIFTKKLLEGFTQTFPMVGLVGNYEARHSLWTINRSLVRMMCAMAAMFAGIRLVMKPYGLPAGLAAGWVGYLIVLGTVLWFERREAIAHGMKKDEAEAEAGQTLSV